MSAEIGQLRLIVAALSAKLKEPREPPAATVKTSEQPAKPGARCYWCDQAGHFERACPAKQSYRRRKRPRRRRQQRKGQHQQAPPLVPPQQSRTTHQKQKGNPADPVVSRQASGGGCFVRPFKRKDQEATLGAVLEWDHEPQALSFLPFVPSTAPVGLAPTPAPVSAKPAAATTTPVPAAEIQQIAQQQPPVRHAVTRTSSPGIGTKSSRTPAKAISPVTVNSVVAVKSVAPRSKQPVTVRVKRPTQPAQQKVMWRP
nr:hypothetical protein BaRGS_007635 [Batillaria attramentaria]KAG5706471.1 hypothetical protein BaRGS_032864 [Batillaria attramentaria]KAG5713023.1 hypothetical protein BaRGS_021817 [Batillaria attramentaria]